MVNLKTLRGLRAALLDCVPGKAQRRRLLEALSRVPGNKSVSEVIIWLAAQEEDSPSQRVSAGRIPPPPKSGVFRTQVIAYSQAAAEVSITMSKATADDLLRSLGRPDDRGLDEALALPFARALRSALEAKHG